MCDDSRLGRPSRPEPVYAVGPMNGVYPLVYQNVVTSFDNTFSVAGGANFSLFNLRAAANYRQAQEGRSMAAAAYEYRRRLILNAARKLYYQTLLLGKVVDVKVASERNARESYANIKLKFDAGLAMRLDELMAEIDWKGKIPELAEARRDYELALMNLKSLAGIDSGEKVELTESLDTYPELPADESLDQALAARPDYRRDPCRLLPPIPPML